MKGNGDIAVRNRWMRISGGPLSASWKAYGVIEGARRMHMRAVIRTAWLRVVRLVDTGAFILPLCWLQSGRVCIGHIWPITHLSRMPEGATCAPNPFIQFRSRKFSPVRERISSSILLRAGAKDAVSGRYSGEAKLAIIGGNWMHRTERDRDQYNAKPWMLFNRFGQTRGNFAPSRAINLFINLLFSRGFPFPPRITQFWSHRKLYFRKLSIDSRFNKFETRKYLSTAR